MMLDGGVVFVVIVIVVIIAFIKGYTYEKRSSNPMDKYSDADIQRFKDIVKDLESSEK